MPEAPSGFSGGGLWVYHRSRSLPPHVSDRPVGKATIIVPRPFPDSPPTSTLAPFLLPIFESPGLFFTQATLPLRVNRFHHPVLVFPSCPPH